MSIQKVEDIHLRLKAEIKDQGLSLAEASRKAGEASPQRLKDVVSGRQKCPADLLAGLARIGIDIVYVLTGHRAEPVQLAPDESALLDNYRHMGKEQRESLSQVSKAMASCSKEADHAAGKG